jgi:cytidine deaminase
MLNAQKKAQAPTKQQNHLIRILFRADGSAAFFVRDMVEIKAEFIYHRNTGLQYEDREGQFEMRTAKHALHGGKKHVPGIPEEEIKKLLSLAIYAREQAYAPYSNFRVGAALVTDDGFFFTGCNIENASYGATNCAERTAIFKAVSEGKRKIKAIAIVGGDKEEITDYTYPCGVCRQVMEEFKGEKGLTVICGISETVYKAFSIEQLLPDSFHNLQDGSAKE